MAEIALKALDGSGQPLSSAFMETLRKSLWAGEMALLEKARHDVAVRGWREGFLFGCNCFGHPRLDRQYDKLFLKIFNYATVLFYWHQPWSEEVQADWIEEFYTICYSKPYITATTWWDFADAGYSYSHGGLVKPDLTPKESYHRLGNLISRWRSV